MGLNQTLKINLMVIGSCSIFFNTTPKLYAQTSPIYPPETQLTSKLQPRNIPRPAYLQPTVDPTFRTTITRVSDRAAMNCTGCNHIRHTYAKNQPWNSDGSRLLLGYSYQPKLLNGHTYQFIKAFALPANEAVWSNTNPNLLYDRNVIASGSTFRPNNQLIKIDVNASTTTTTSKTVLHTFIGYDSISIGEGEGNLSNDDRYVALVGHKGSSKYMIIYEIPADRIIKEELLGTGDIDWISMSQSGKYVVASWRPDGPGNQQGLKVYTLATQTWRHATNSTQHGDLGYDQSGNEVFVQFHSQTWDIHAWHLGSATNYPVIKSNHSTHISCRNLNRPGWCYVSDAHPIPGKEAYLGFNETYALKIQPANAQGQNTVQRFAHQHQSCQTIVNGACDIGYDGEAMSSPNRDGSKIIFASDWELRGPPFYAYVAEYKSTQSPTSTPIPTTTPQYKLFLSKWFTLPPDFNSDGLFNIIDWLKRQ